MNSKNIKAFRFEYRGPVGEIEPMIDAFCAYLRANQQRPLDIVLAAMPADAQEKMRDIEQP